MGSEISPSLVRTLLLPLSVCPGLCRSLHWQVPCVWRWKGPPAVSDLHHSQLAFSGRKRLCRELQYKSQVWPSGSQWSGLVGHLPLKPSLCPGRQCILAMPSSRTAPPRSYVLRMGVMAPQKDTCRWSLCQGNVSKKRMVAIGDRLQMHNTLWILLGYCPSSELCAPGSPGYFRDSAEDFSLCMEFLDL